MKITKAKLKQIIKEELEASIGEGIFDRVKKAFGSYTPVEPTKEAIDAMKMEMKELVEAQINYVNGRGAPPDMNRISEVVNIVKQTPAIESTNADLYEEYGATPLRNDAYYFLRMVAAGYFDEEIFSTARVGGKLGSRRILYLGVKGDSFADNMKVTLINKANKKKAEINLYVLPKDKPSKQDIYDHYEPTLRRVGVRSHDYVAQGLNRT